MRRESAARGSLGLLGMRERARELGGTVAIRNRPGEGTTVRISIPLAPEAERPPPGLDGARSPAPPDGASETARRAAPLPARSYA